MITLEPNETVILTARKHWLVFVTEVIGVVVLGIAPFVLLIVVSSFGIDVTRAIPGNAALFFSALLAGWLTLIWIALFVAWTHYYLDMLIVTDKHIIEAEQHGLFSREVSTFGRERVQDVTIDTHGLLATILNFGDVHIQTAGESREFILASAARPEHVKECVLGRSDIDKNI